MFLNSDIEVSSESQVMVAGSKIKWINATYFLLKGSDLFTNFQFNESLYIGGVKDLSQINHQFRITKGFNGAIQKVNVTLRFFI